MQELPAQVDNNALIPQNLKIVYFPSKKLNQKSVQIIESIPDSKNLQNLIKSMFITMEMQRGVGLSAIQVGVPLALFVLNIDGNKKTVINPSIKTQEGHSFENEGCISIPLMRTRVVRPEKIEVSYMDEFGVLNEKTLTGFEARAFCHEYDHLQGLTMLDKITSIARNSLLKKYKKLFKF